MPMIPINILRKKYTKHFSEEVKDFNKEISENRKDSLLNFAKTVKKIYHYKDKKTIIKHCNRFNLFS